MSQLSVWDYVVFASMLLLSSVIGLYHGYKSSKKKASTKEYLLANQSLGWFPIFFSLLATYISAIALLGMPSEVYTYGIMYIMIFASYPLVICICIFIYAPIFRKNQVTSVNEYLELRFSRPVRLFGSLMYNLNLVMYLAVVLFAPSLALDAVAGVPLPISLVTVGLVGTIYTTFGGMKGVIYTDIFQLFIMVAGLIIVIAVGTYQVGGIQKVFEIAQEGGRLNFFNFSPDPTIRHTFWTLAVGGTFSALPVYCVSQPMVQRFMAAKSLKTVNIALLMNIPGLMFVVGLCCLAGLVMYGVYEKCDLKTTKKIQTNDQILAYFLVHKLSHLKGIPGVFMASLFSGALSTASSGLNSLAAVTYEDFVRTSHPHLSEEKATRITKLFAFGYGLLVIALAFAVNYVGTLVLQIAYTIHGVIGAPTMGMFALGVLFPWGNSVGAVVGCLFGFGITLWLSIGAIMFPPDKNILDVSIQQCATFNSTATNNTGIISYPHLGYSNPLASTFYSISYMYYAAIGLSVSFVVGCIVSLLFSGRYSKEKNKNLLFNYAACCPQESSLSYGVDRIHLDELKTYENSKYRRKKKPN